MRRVSCASTRFWSSSRGFSTAARMACAVISWNTIRLIGTFGLRVSTRCQAMASPSRSSSVARYSSDASASSFFSLVTCCLRSGVTTYSGSKPWSTSTPSRAHDSPLYLAGTSAALRGRSRMWPMLDSTTYPRPRYEEIFFALAGDSTITSRVRLSVFAVATFLQLCRAHGYGGQCASYPPHSVKRVSGPDASTGRAE